MQTKAHPENSSAQGPTWRRARLALVLTLLAAGPAAGCGSTSNSLDEFLGTWSAGDPNTTFGSFTCTIFTQRIDMFTLWPSLLTLEPGTLVDLVETRGTCPFNFNTKGKVATVPVLDPYTNQAPACRIDITPSTSPPGTEFLEFQPISWEFDLLQPLKGVAAPAHMFGSANIVHVTVNATTGAETVDTNCSTYTVDASLSKITKN